MTRYSSAITSATGTRLPASPDISQPIGLTQREGEFRWEMRRFEPIEKNVIDLAVCGGLQVRIRGPQWGCFGQ
jgi:hypothetical protein